MKDKIEKKINFKKNIKKNPNQPRLTRLMSIKTVRTIFSKNKNLGPII